MKQPFRRILSLWILSPLAVWVLPLAAATPAAAKPGAKATAPAKAAAKDATGRQTDVSASTSEAAAWSPQISRTVKVGPKDITLLSCSLRYETLIVLPESEQILDLSTGDRDFWVITGVANFCHIKPAQADLESNLHIITAAGHIYSFVLRETSKYGQPVDHKVFVEPSEAMNAQAAAKPRFVGREQLDQYKTVMEAEVARWKSSHDRALSEVSRFQSEYPAKLLFDYEFKANSKPIPVTAMYHDDRFTYIKCTATEKPALYELKDGQPNLVNFELQGDTYIVSKVLHSGYLQVGKARLPFKRKEG